MPPRLRIAQVAPLYESVPPPRYGGTERVVSYVTEELVRRGHDVSLYASADSVTEARLVPFAPKALRLDRPPNPVTRIMRHGLVTRPSENPGPIRRHAEGRRARGIEAPDPSRSELEERAWSARWSRGGATSLRGEQTRQTKERSHG